MDILGDAVVGRRSHLMPHHPNSGLCMHIFCIALWPLVFIVLYLGKRGLVIKYRNQISSNTRDIFFIGGRIEASDVILAQSFHFSKNDIQRQDIAEQSGCGSRPGV